MFIYFYFYFHRTGKLIDVVCSTLFTLTDVPTGFEHGLDDAVAAGTLSSLQMESIIYASVKHEQRLRGGQRAGFFLGDGPGVGKGRQIAGLVSFSLFSYCMGN